MARDLGISIISEAKFKKSFAEYIKIAQNGRIFVIKRRGIPAAIVIPFSDKPAPKQAAKIMKKR